jgi:hypothetical protein
VKRIGGTGEKKIWIDVNVGGAIGRTHGRSRCHDGSIDSRRRLRRPTVPSVGRTSTSAADMFLPFGLGLSITSTGD